MLRPRRILGLAILLAAALLLAVAGSAAQNAPKSSAASPTSSQKAKHRSKKAAPVAEVPQAPPPPPTLEQQPPTAPQVTYTNGQLSISSTNATLSQILRSVQTQTGASIDIPPGAGNERVVATLGPGKPQAVLASLLNGSKFNYVILGEPNNPGTVQKVILLAKSAGGSSQAPDTVAQNNYHAPQPQPPQTVEPPDDEYQQSEPEVENQNPGQLSPGQPGMPGSENLTPDNINPAGRTPEQMLQELQRMQQQQQQMQQQLNPANQQQPQGTAFPSQAPPPQPQ
jgi:hypothetical protein